MSGRDPRLDPEPPLLRRLLRDLLVLLARLLLPLRGGRPAPAGLRRVLVVRPDDRVGNALLTLPLVRALQRALPGAQVELLLASARAGVARGLPGLALIEFDKRALLRRPLSLLSLVRRLRGAGYDAVIDAAHWHSFSTTSALLARAAARRFLVGPDRGPTGLYSVAVPPPPEGMREVEAKLLLGQGLGLDLLAPGVPPLETALGTSEEQRGFVARVRRELGAAGEGPLVILNPGGRKADHRWPAAQFGVLAAALRARHGHPSLVTWGPGEEGLAAEVIAASAGAARLAPPSDLGELAALLREAALAVTNDTGPMHLAVACGAPVLALLLSADGARWSHPGPRFAGLAVGGGGDPQAQLGAALEAAGRLLALTGAPAQASLRRS